MEQPGIPPRSQGKTFSLFPYAHFRAHFIIKKSFVKLANACMLNKINFVDKTGSKKRIWTCQRILPWDRRSFGGSLHFRLLMPHLYYYLTAYVTN